MTTLKKGDKAKHVNRGVGTLTSEIGGGPNKGTMFKLENGEEFEASTVYLKPVQDERPAENNSRTASGS